MNEQERQDREAAYKRLRELVTEYLEAGRSLDSPAIFEVNQAYKEARAKQLYNPQKDGSYHHA